MGLSFFLGQPFLLFVSCGTGLLAKLGFGFILNCGLRFSVATSFPISLKSAVRLRLWLLGFGFTPRYGIHFWVVCCRIQSSLSDAEWSFHVYKDPGGSCLLCIYRIIVVRTITQ